MGAVHRNGAERIRYPLARTRSSPRRIPRHEHSAWGARRRRTARPADQRSMGGTLDTKIGGRNLLGIFGRGGGLCTAWDIEPPVAGQLVRDARAFRQFAGVGVLDNIAAIAERR